MFKNNSRLLAIALFSCSMVAEALDSRPTDQSDEDYARGDQYGHHACSTICNPKPPIGNATSGSYAFGWIAGCTRAGGLNAACPKDSNGNSGGGSQGGSQSGNTQSGNTQVFTPPQTQARLLANILSNRFNRVASIISVADSRLKYASSASLAQLRDSLKPFYNELSALGDPITLLEMDQNPSQQQVDALEAQLRDVVARLDAEEQKHADLIRSFSLTPAAAFPPPSPQPGNTPNGNVGGGSPGGNQPANNQAVTSLQAQTQRLYDDSADIWNRSAAIASAAAAKLRNRTAGKDGGAYSEIYDNFTKLKEESAALTDEARLLLRNGTPTQQQLDSLEARLRDLAAREQAEEQKYIALISSLSANSPPVPFASPTTAPGNPVVPPNTLTQPTPEPGEPSISTQEALDHLRSHPELLLQAKQIVDSMKAQGRSEEEIDRAIRNFVADERSKESASSVPPLTAEGINELVAQHPELKRQMQDYADELKKDGKSEEEIHLAVYTRLNEIHAEQVRATGPAQSVRETYADNVSADRADGVQSRGSETIQQHTGDQVRPGQRAQDVQSTRAGDVKQYQSDPIKQQRAQGIQGYQSQPIREDSAQSVRPDQAQTVNATRAQGVEQYRAQDIQQDRAQDVQGYTAQGIQRDKAQDVQAFKSKDIQQYKAQDIQSDRAQDVQQYQAQDVQAYKAQDVQRYQAQDIASDRAQDVQRYQAQDVQAYKAQDIQQYQAQDIQPDRTQEIQRYRAQDVQAYKAQDIQQYQAQDVRPAAPAEEVKLNTTPSRTNGGCQKSRRSTMQQGNLVEPLSNGLMLSWTDGDIKNNMGEPAERNWDSRAYGYPGIWIVTGGGRSEIWRVTLRADCVQMNSGVGPGSSRADVVRAFGKAYEVTYDQYKLTFAYDGDRVSEVKIEPAEGSFRAMSTGSARKASAQSQSTSSSDAPSSMAGDWYCVVPNATVGTIKIKNDGTYTFGSNSGRWSMHGDQIQFSGIPWNGGKAQMVGGNIQFLWKDAAGHAYYFVFARY